MLHVHKGIKKNKYLVFANIVQAVFKFFNFLRSECEISPAIYSQDDNNLFIYSHVLAFVSKE